MKIQCQNCGVEHEIAPPSWVVSSGRAFRFRCSSCGYSQSVHPSTLSEESSTEPPDLEAPIPSFPPPTSVEEESEELHEVESLAEPEEEEPELVADAPFEQDPLSSMDDVTPSSSSGTSAVFLKQNGQIYMVSDWDTLKRWIAESRVERHDLVSEGGVRWEPVGNRTELMSAFGGAAPAQSPFPFGGETPFGADSGGGNLGWHDDDTEGVPTGLPPLPTDEVPRADARGFDALDARLRKMTPTPPPVARRAPPPARPSFLTPTPAPVARIDQDEIATASPEPREYAPPAPPISTGPAAPPEPEMSIAPPALPDTVPPAPVRKPPAPALLPEDDPDITQKRVILDAHMRPKAYQMADEDTIKTQPLGRDNVEISDLHDLPPLTEPLYAEPESTDEEIVIRRTNPMFYVASVGLILLIFVACFGLTSVLTPPRRTAPEPIPSLPLPTPTPTPEAPAPVEDPQPVADPEPSTDPEPTATEPTATEPAAPEPTAPEPTAPKPAEPTPAPIAPASPTPTPAPAPVRPQPAPPPRPAPSANVNGLIDAGWGLVDANPNTAAEKFRQAVQKAPANPDANFGYGYALVKQGKQDQARSYLCRAIADGSLDTRREAQATLLRAGLSCGG